MRRLLRNILNLFFAVVCFVCQPFTFVATGWLKFVRNRKKGRSIFMFWGTLPVNDHYYEPLINPRKHLQKSLREDRNLPGIDLNTEEQLQLLAKFNYNEELLQFPLNKIKNKLTFFYRNGTFCSGDAEYLFCMIRHFKPARIIEIGSGSSTLVSINARNKNKQDNPLYDCRITCIEPYEQQWLEQLEIEVVRSKVEDVNINVFKTLEKNDILFIDSSHIIRPQGDVLLEYLEILPLLNPGVLIHVHDIFTPKDYLDEWIFGKDHRLWNEQYLLEAFLTFNNQFKIIGALNYLSHHHKKEFSAKCPVYAQETGREPGSFWMIKL